MKSSESPCNYVHDLYYLSAFRNNVHVVPGVFRWSPGNVPVLYNYSLPALDSLLFLPISLVISVVKRKSSWISPELFSIS